ncbi:MAG: ABC transporter substrate-binding protein [Bacteroidota bacterium]
MIKKSTFLVSWLLFVITLGYGQNYQQSYLSAKALFNEGKYGLAREAFKPLIAKNELNDFSAYASFYYAVSSYRDGFPALAKDMFLQIKQLYPKWTRIDEVNYWLGQIYLETESYDAAISVLREIRKDEIETDGANLKRYYFSKIEEYDLLVELYKTYPSEPYLANELAATIAKQPLVNQDHDLLNEIIERFELDPNDFNMVSKSESVFKDEYRVAVLYPFMVNDLQPNDRRKFNQFILDIYNGIRLAADSLNRKGVRLKLLSYDTRRSERQLESILEKEEMLSVDVIIGPFSSKLTERVNEFSFKNKINVINPLRTDSEVIGNNPYSFLYYPSNETMGKKMAEYTLKNKDRRPGVIIYGQDKSDSVLAYSYKEQMEKDSFNIIITKKVHKDSTRQILDLFLVKDTKLGNAGSSQAKERYQLAPDSISHVFIASDDELIASKIVSAVDTRGDSIMIIGPSSWLELPVINYDDYRRLGISLYAPAYQKRSDEIFNSFREAYIRKHRVVPSKHASIGYDLMMLLGEGLDKHGKYFQIGWGDQKFIDGCLTVGHRYELTNDNNIVPILTFEDKGVKISYEIDEDRYAVEE